MDRCNKSQQRETKTAEGSDAGDEVMYWMVITMLHDATAICSKGGLSHNHWTTTRTLPNLCAGAATRRRFWIPLHSRVRCPRITLRFGLRNCTTSQSRHERLLGRMKTVTPSFALPWVTQPTTGRQLCRHFSANWRRFARSPPVRKWLKDKAKLYRKLARLCTEKRIPSRATIKKVSSIWNTSIYQYPGTVNPLCFGLVRACSTYPGTEWITCSQKGGSMARKLKSGNSGMVATRHH